MTDLTPNRLRDVELIGLVTKYNATNQQLNELVDELNGIRRRLRGHYELVIASPANLNEEHRDALRKISSIGHIDDCVSRLTDAMNRLATYLKDRGELPSP